MIKLSAVIITYNEAQNIQRCISSLQDITDEVVVVDSFSSDKTDKIAADLGAKVIRHNFEGHIQQKNFALKKANYNHVLSLDADEALSEVLKDAILSVKENWKADGYYLLRYNRYCGQFVKYSTWKDEWRLRLFDKRRAKWGGKNPHDKVVMHSNATTKKLNGHLYHYRFDTISAHVQQVNYFSDINSKEAYEKGDDVGMVSIMTKTFWRFFRDFIFRLGILEGKKGLFVSAISAWEVFLKWAKAWEYKVKAREDGKS